MKNTRLYQYVIIQIYDFSVDYDSTDAADILDIKQIFHAFF